MRHFPVFLDTEGRKIIVVGAGHCAEAKLRLILKTQAQVVVFGQSPSPQVTAWAGAGHMILEDRLPEWKDVKGAALLYGAEDDPARDARTRELGDAAGVPTLIVDNLEASDFITPAMVDRDPVVVAIGTEGSAPMLARRIKADLEARLPQSTGPVARLAALLRGQVVALPNGAPRRSFWARFFDGLGESLLSLPAHAQTARVAEAMEAVEAETGHVDFVGIGTGDPELLTLKARRALDRAELVCHDPHVPMAVLELARREAMFICDPSAQDLAHHGARHHVVRLVAGTPDLSGAQADEARHLAEEAIPFTIIPGVALPRPALAFARSS